MIHPALYKLIGLQARSIIRRMLRGAHSPGRLLIFLLGALICGAWLFSALTMANHHPRTELAREKAISQTRDIMPLALLGICVITAVTSVGDKAIAFTPGEVDQLFPGPFTRRELLGYKLIKSTLGAILTALFLSVVMLRHARWWPACFVAVFLSLIFIQFFSIALLLGGQAVGLAAYTRLRKFIAVAAGVAVVFAARTWMSSGAGGGEAALQEFRTSPVGRIVLVPLEPFGMLMVSAHARELIKCALLAGLLNVGLLVLVFLLDAYYLETAMAASERRYAKIQRVRAGSFLSVGVSKTAQWHLPQLPWAGGAGVIAWRQLTNAARSSRGLMLLLTIVAVGAAPALSMAGHGAQALQLLLGVMGWLTFLCSSMLNFDFRGDIDHIETLKALPLRGWAVTLGQLVAPVLLLTVFHLLLLGIALVVVPIHRELVGVALVLVLPFNMLLFGAENLIFLLFPSRPTAVSPGDFQVLGRKFVYLLAKMLILSGACGLALFFAIIVWIATAKHLPAATAVGWVVLTIEALAMVPLIARAYRRFDPSLHTPA